MARLPPCLVLSGPTASGKTGMLDSLAALSPWPIEVISADAFQVYRGLDKGTAKPDPGLVRRIPHHLIDIRDIRESYTVGDFVRDANGLIDALRLRGCLPVVCGGSVYYLKHLLWGSPATPPSDPEIRLELRRDWVQGHDARLRAELAAVDPESAARIHPHDSYRILRAIEVWRCSGRPLSSFAATSGTAGLPGQGAVLVVGLERARDDLLERIRLRVGEMMASGLAGEVTKLAEMGHSPDEPGMRAIGYQEFFTRLDGGGWRVRSDLAGVEEEIVIHTRQYAKRQMTFLRGLKGLVWLPAGDPMGSGQEIMRRLREYGK